MNKLVQALHNIQIRIEKLNWDWLWPGFLPTNYLVYDGDVFLSQQEILDPPSTKTKEGFYTGSVDARFMGNTAIQLDGKQVAIWDLRWEEESTDWDVLASKMVHEMFHCYQFSLGETRFPNELLGADYPITVDNLSLRFAEREALYEAVTEYRFAKLSEFFSYRNERRIILGEYMDYELATETTEGLAVYVEYRALKQLNPEITLEQFMNGFLDVSLKNVRPRQSSYLQGLLLGCLADELDLDWQKDFIPGKLYLSNWVMLMAVPRIQDLSIHVATDEVKNVVSEWHGLVDEAFLSFERCESRKTFIGDIQVLGLDPMNLVKRGNEVIHQRFLSVALDGDKQILTGPIKATIGKHLFDVIQLEWQAMP